MKSQDLGFLGQIDSHLGDESFTPAWADHSVVTTVLAKLFDLNPARVEKFFGKLALSFGAIASFLNNLQLDMLDTNLPLSVVN